MDRLNDVRDILTSHHEDMRSLIGGLDDADLDRRTENGWSIRMMAGHIAESPKGDIYVLKRLTAGKNATLPKPLAFILDLVNWKDVRKFRRATKPDLLSVLETEHNAIFAYVTALSEEQLDRRGIVFGRGELSALEYLQQTPAHGREHGASIRNAVAAPSEGAGSPV